jgi:hypothetical protein
MIKTGFHDSRATVRYQPNNNYTNVLRVEIQKDLNRENQFWSKEIWNCLFD